MMWQYWHRVWTVLIVIIMRLGEFETASANQICGYDVSVRIDLK